MVAVVRALRNGHLREAERLTAFALGTLDLTDRKILCLTRLKV
jgi:hypothetical protein